MYHSVSQNTFPYSAAVQNAMAAAGTTIQFMVYPGITIVPEIISPIRISTARANVCQVVYDRSTGTNMYVCTSGRYINPARTRSIPNRESY